MYNKRRTIPRHVDGRYKIGLVYWKSFLFPYLPVAIITMVFSLAFAYSAKPAVAPFIIGGCILFLFFFYLFLAEFNGETGFYMMISALRYLREGDIHFERSSIYVEDKKRKTVFKHPLLEQSKEE